ncbi:MAG: Uma2 family endonuclease [Gammaproteobacteria bacterium]|nr:MAG: Uma2 family endonuclease [Gammaproteobacteria bacterium]
MADAAPRKARYEDLLELPDNAVGEILAGQLYASPRPAPRHARASTALTGSLWDPYDRGDGGPGGWWILDEPELHLGEDVLVPDLAGWRRERMPELPETAWFGLAPDWVCEILSPATARIDRGIKMGIYAREQVPFLWLVDPDARTLEVYRLEGPHWLLLTTLKEDDPVRQPPFDSTEFLLDRLWA